MSHSEILGLLSQKKRLKSKDFIELYDAIWESAHSKFQSSTRIRHASTRSKLAHYL